MAAPSTRANVILSLTDKMSPKLRRISSGLDSMAIKARRAGQAMLIGAAALGFALKKAYDQAAGLEFNMRLVAASAQSINTTQLKELTDLAKELGRTTSFTSLEVSALMGVLAKAGLASAGIKAATADLLDFARAAQISTEQAASFAVGTLNSFDMDITADNIRHAGDVMTFAAHNSTMEVEDLGEAMKLAAPIAKEFGQSMESVAATVAVMANSNVKGSMTGRGLRNVFAAMVNKGGELAEVLGVDLKDGAGNIKNLGQILGEFDAKTQKMDSLAKIQLMNEAWGKLGLGTVLIGGKGADAILNLGAAMKDLNGYVKQTVGILDNSAQGDMLKLWSAFSGILQAIGEQLVPIVRTVGPAITRVFNIITPMVKTFKGLGVSLVALFAGLATGAAILLSAAAAATVLSVVFGSLAFIISSIPVIIAAVGAAFTAVVAVLPGIIMGVVVAIGLWATALTLFEPLIQDIQNAFSVFFMRVQKGFGNVQKAMKAYGPALAWKLAMAQMELATHEALSSINKDWKAWYLNIVGYYDMITMKQREFIDLLQTGLAVGLRVAVGDISGSKTLVQDLKHRNQLEKNAYDERVRLRQLEGKDTDKAKAKRIQATIDAIDAELLRIKTIEDAEKAQMVSDKKNNFGGGVKFGPIEEPEAHKKARLAEEKREAAKAKREAAAAKRAHDALFEEVRYKTVVSMGSMGGGSAAAVSAKLSSSVLQVAKDQLEVMTEIKHNLEKNRTDKGIWRT